jgi:hypothetical protein
MTLKSYKNILSLLILFFLITPIQGEEKIDIWKNNNENKISEDKEMSNPKKIEKNIFNSIKKIQPNEEVKIEDKLSENTQEINVFGIYDPAENNFDLNMWSSTKAEDIKASLKRLKKIKLSNISSEILENILLSFSYSPLGMKDNEFVDLKINWLIENNKSNLIESFLKQNKDFSNKGKAVQYLVDENIAQADIKKGCEKIRFIDSGIKDSYLEKFKIYCLVFDNKKNEAQLLLDLLREQNQSDKFFDDKINFLLGITKKTTKKIKEDSLINFYLSSITITDFKYEPTSKTKKEIWKYLNASNLIKLDDIENKEKLKDLELAANLGQVDEKLIFEIYKRIPFNLNSLVNAKNIYQTLNKSDSRALIYQKYLLSENSESSLEYLFLLEDLFKKENLMNIYREYLSNTLKEIGLENIPEAYQEIAKDRIFSKEKLKLGKIRYNDKVLHQSKIIKFYTENDNIKKTQKEINKTFKKISKNRKYFYSGKDLALVETLIKDGFNIPSNLNFKGMSNKYEVPKNLFKLIENNQNAFLALKIVEIIGEDEPYQLDPETIYFITHLLNEMNLIEIRNKVLTSALPLRT